MVASDQCPGLTDFTEFSLLGHTDTITSLAWHPDGTVLASASSDHTIQVWDVQSGLDNFFGDRHNDGVNDVAWHPGGTIFASASADHSVGIWNANWSVSSISITTLYGHTGEVQAVAFSPLESFKFLASQYAHPLW